MINSTVKTTIGVRLRQLRLAKNITLDQVSKEIKIPAKYLSLIERDALELLPEMVYSREYYKVYADFLGFDGLKISEEFELEFKSMQYQQSKTSGKKIFGLSPRNEKEIITSKILTFSVFSLLACIVLGVLFWQLSSLVLDPELTLSADDYVEVNSDKYVLEGKTSSDNLLKINETTIFTDIDGSFIEVLELNPGNNNFQISATNQLGNVAIRDIVVNSNIPIVSENSKVEITITALEDLELILSIDSAKQIGISILKDESRLITANETIFLKTNSASKTKLTITNEKIEKFDYGAMDINDIEKSIDISKDSTFILREI